MPLKRLLVAVSFLTRVPVPISAIGADDLGQAALFFPVVGALLGGAVVLGQVACSPLLPAPLCAVVLVGIGVIGTGALHLDGLADMADGFGGGRTREDVLRIMRDHAVGAFGVIALVLLLATKITATQALLDERQGSSVLLLAPVLGRWAIVPVGYFCAYARPSGGLGAAFTGHVGKFEVVGATLLTGLGAGALLGLRGLLLTFAVAAAASLLGWICVRRIGGVTGDTLGATIEACETLTLVLGVATR
ncbi:MAG: adenosylcobinamide-GDP ribazoletransferase [Deltaproteobacteria bacterium]|nr:adenosylcobinamide-GDP ribazoletransferase [Deltaproteobacteria bacterium]